MNEGVSPSPQPRTEGWRILMIEDDPQDAELLQNVLQTQLSVEELKWVETKEDFLLALADGPWDLILSDYHVPGFGAPIALTILRELGLKIPFVVTSSRVGEEATAEVMREGAHDFVVKGQWQRLIVAIYRAVDLVREHEARCAAERELQASQEQLRDLVTAQEGIRERERASLSRELHDELGQLLTGLKLDLLWCRARQPEQDPELRERMAQGLQLVDQTADAVRRIATDLRPALLDDLGLAAAVEWYARDFAHRSGLDVECFIEDENFNPPDRYAIALYRVLQEALTNIARHARAKRAQVSLMHRAGIAQLHVRDDGCGYEIEPQRKDKTLGLISMRERVAAVGGELRIDSATGKGTTIFVRLPIDSGDSHAD